MQEGAPVYVKVDDYKDVLDVVSLIKEKIREAETILNNLNEAKAREDAEIENWKSSISEVKSKVVLIDKALLDVKSV
jgi:hypothetical protein